MPTSLTTPQQQLWWCSPNSTPSWAHRFSSQNTFHWKKNHVTPLPVCSAAAQSVDKVCRKIVSALQTKLSAAGPEASYWTTFWDSYTNVTRIITHGWNMSCVTAYRISASSSHGSASAEGTDTNTNCTEASAFPLWQQHIATSALNPFLCIFASLPYVNVFNIPQPF